RLDGPLCDWSSLLPSVRNQESVAHIEGVELANVAEPFLPRPGFKIGFEVRDPACDHVLVKERKAGDPCSYLWIEIRLGSTPVRGEESIDTIVRDSDAVHSAIPKVAHEISNRGTASAIELDDLREVGIGEPKVADFTGLEGEDHEAIR